MADLKFSLEFLAKDHISDVVKGIQRGLGGLKGSLKELGEASEAFGKSMLGVGAIVGEGFSLKGVAETEDYFRRLGIITGQSESAVENLKHTIQDTAIASRVSIESMTGAFKGLRESGGSIDLFTKNADVLGAGIQLLGGHGDELGETLSHLDHTMKMSGPGQFASALATMHTQMMGVDGALDNFLGSFKELSADMATLGQTGPEAVKSLGAVYTMMSMASHNPRAARSETNAFLMGLTQSEFQNKLMSHGVAVWKGNDRSKGMRDVSDIVRDIAKLYATNPYAEQQMGPELAKMFRVPIGEIKATGKSASLDKLLSAEGDPAAFMDKAARASQSLSGSLNVLKASVEKFGDRHLAGPIQWLADTLANMSDVTAMAVTGFASFAAVGNAIGWVVSAATAFKGLAKALKIVTAAEWLFNAALWANPITWVVAGITLAGVAIYELATHWDWITAKFKQFTAWAGSLFEGPIAAIKDLIHWFSELLGWVDKTWDKSKPNKDAKVGNRSSGGSKTAYHQGSVGSRSSVALNGQSLTDAVAFFQAKGWSPEQAAGIVANLNRESKLNTGAVGDHGQAYGIAQWHPDRQAAFAKFAGRDIRGSSLQDQLGFVDWELRNSETKAGDRLAGARTAGEAGSIVSSLYERPAAKDAESALRGRDAESIFKTAQASKVEGTIHVKIDAPQGTQVAASSEGDLGLSVDRGLSMAWGT